MNRTSKVWMTEEVRQYFNEISNKFIMNLMWGCKTEPRVPKYEDDLKYANVEIDGKPTIIYVNNKDMKGYKTDFYSLVEPLEEVEYKFIRWSRPMDI